MGDATFEYNYDEDGGEIGSLQLRGDTPIPAYAILGDVVVDIQEGFAGAGNVALRLGNVDPPVLLSPVALASYVTPGYAVTIPQFDSNLNAGASVLMNGAARNGIKTTEESLLYLDITDDEVEGGKARFIIHYDVSTPI